MNQWYQTVVPRDYAIEKFYLIKGFLGCMERKTATVLYFEKTPEVKKQLNSFNLSVISEGDWVEKWKEYFKPVKMGTFTVVPPWDSRSGNLIISPSVGFGTGHHETTRLAAFLLEYVLKNDSDIKTVLDVGTGSGILSIVALKIQPDLTVTGIDNDKEVLKNALENEILNNMANKINFLSDPIFRLKEQFDIVVANIISSVLYTLKNDFKRLASNWLILTGTLETETDFLTKMNIEDFELIKEVTENKWKGFLLMRKKSK